MAAAWGVGVASLHAGAAASRPAVHDGEAGAGCGRPSVVDHNGDDDGDMGESIEPRRVLASNMVSARSVVCPVVPAATGSKETRRVRTGTAMRPVGLACTGYILFYVGARGGASRRRADRRWPAPRRVRTRLWPGKKGYKPVPLCLARALQPCRCYSGNKSKEVEQCTKGERARASGTERNSRTDTALAHGKKG